jgi:hypothetical protein
MEVRLQNRTPYGVAPSLRLSCRLWLRVHLKFWQEYPEKSEAKTEGHVARGPQALSRVISLELKGHLVECVLSCS